MCDTSMIIMMMVVKLLVFHKEPLDNQVVRCTIGDKGYDDKVHQMNLANLMKIKVVMLIVDNSSQDGEVDPSHSQLPHYS